VPARTIARWEQPRRRYHLGQPRFPDTHWILDEKKEDSSNMEVQTKPSGLNFCALYHIRARLQAAAINCPRTARLKPAEARLKPCPGVSTSGFTAGSLLITALSKGRGYGEAGVRGCFLRSKSANPSPIPHAGSPLSPQAGEGCCQLVFRRQAKMYKLRLSRLRLLRSRE
jgi:hypothetical protein